MKRILIIEDDTDIAELQRDYFELNGFRVELAHDGKTGLEQALANPPDLIVLDLQLPSLDGFEIGRRLRERLEVPILIVSARQEEVDKIRAFGFGADDYMTKPFSPSELVARARAHLLRYERLVGKGSPAGRSERIDVRELSIDRSSRRVFVRDREVSLTAREFDLLVFLATHPNRVFSKEELFERIWGLEAEGDLATVTVHVRKIREKIEADPSAPRFIETVWGAGYRFAV